MRLAYSLIIAAAFLATFAGAAAPLGADSGPTAQVRQILDEAMDIQTRADLQGPDHRKERLVLARKIISDNFLSADMAREAIGEYWGKITPAEREQYQELFSALFENSYTRMLLESLKKEDVEYPGEVPDGKYTRVKTVIKRPHEEIPVDYVMEHRNQRWYIRDLVIEGISAVNIYRAQFINTIQKQSFDQLINLMRAKKEAGDMEG
jgi:phospholipid transport system substrate-binding protein